MSNSMIMLVPGMTDPSILVRNYTFRKNSIMIGSLVMALIVKTLSEAGLKCFKCGIHYSLGRMLGLSIDAIVLWP